MLVGFGAGAALALAARRPLARTDDPVHTRYFAVAALWAGLLLTPAALALYLAFPDWSLMYLANPAHVSSLLVFPLALVGCLGAPLAGFLGGHALLRRAQGHHLARLVAGCAFLVAAVAVLGRERLAAVAYYDAFHGGGEAVPLLRSSLLVAVLPSAVAVLGILGFTLVSVDRHARVTETLPPGLGAADGPGDRHDSTPERGPAVAAGHEKPANLPRPSQGATRDP